VRATRRRPAEREDRGPSPGGRGTRVCQLWHDRDIEPSGEHADHTPVHGRYAASAGLFGPHCGAGCGGFRAPRPARPRGVRRLRQRPGGLHRGRLLPHGRYGGASRRLSLRARAHGRHVHLRRRERVSGGNRRRSRARSRRGRRLCVRAARRALGTAARSGSGADAGCAAHQHPGLAGGAFPAAVEALRSRANIHCGRVAAVRHRQDRPRCLRGAVQREHRHPARGASPRAPAVFQAFQNAEGDADLPRYGHCRGDRPQGPRRVRGVHGLRHRLVSARDPR